MSTNPVENMSVPMMDLMVTFQVREAGAILVVDTRRGPLYHELPV